MGHSKTVPDRFTDTGLGQSPIVTPGSGFMREGPHTSTPGSDVDAMSRLTDMVGQLGAQIGESIVAKLMSAGVVTMNGGSRTTSANQSAYDDTNGHDATHVTVHVKSDRELQTFRGDNSDKYSVQDWIDMTKTYLRKQGVPVCDQAEEIMNHLMGKARDVVKIALRSDPLLDVTQNPELMYDVLLHYFSDAPSCLPLADFYATLPKHKENPVDYWIRLNKAADLALEGLRRRGKQTENMNGEVALMFVKHCPDPELSCTLKCKPMHEWTSRDVQLRIDDYQSELRASCRLSGIAQLKSHTTTVSSEGPSQPSTSETVIKPSHAPGPLPSSLQGQHHLCIPSCAAPATGSGQNESQCASNHASVPVVAQNLQQSEESLLTRMVDMFQEMMEKLQHRNVSHSTRGGKFQHARSDRRSREATCKVCNNPSHTTTSHCISDKLCFSCFAPGHTRLNCPASIPPQSQSGGN